MKPVKLLFVVLGLMVANPLFAADASNYSEDYSQPEEYGAEDDYTDNSAADYTATDYTDSEQYNYDQSEDTSDANWEADHHQSQDRAEEGGEGPIPFHYS